MKAAFLIAAGTAAFVVAATPAVGGKSQGSAFLTDARSGYSSLHTNVSVLRGPFISDGRDGYGVTADRWPGYRFVTDTRGGYGQPAPVADTGAPNVGFAWGDAAIGAGAGASILALLGGGTLIALRRRGSLAL